MNTPQHIDHLKSDASMTYEEYNNIIHENKGKKYPHNISFRVHLIQESLKESLENDKQKEIIFQKGYQTQRKIEQQKQ